MRPKAKILTIVLAVVMTVIAVDAAAARPKKHHAPRHHVSNVLGVHRDLDGTPIIMQGLGSDRHAIQRDEESRRRRSHRSRSERHRRSVRIPRGSSSFVDIPPVNPAPNAPNSPPARALTQPPVQPYRPPPITTYSDRVTNCIHSFPLNGGIGNNPRDQQSYVRQCAN